MEKDIEESNKSKNVLNINDDSSKVSLKLSANEKKLITVQNVISFKEDDKSAGPSNRITAEITLSCNFKEDGMNVTKGILQNVFENVVGPSKSKQFISVENSQGALKIDKNTNSSNHEIFITPPATPPVVLYTAPPLPGAPPTYSAITRIGPTEVHPRSVRLFGRRELQIQPSPPFVAPVPPPSYNESQGIITNQPTRTQSLQIGYQDSMWGPHPVSLICPTCNNFIITNIQTRRSNLTHISALALCLCGCWPCCLLPYCLQSCKSTYHECPVCFNVTGHYNPWIVSAN